jgi:hypothetical protein
MYAVCSPFSDIGSFMDITLAALPGWMTYFALQGFLNGQGVWWPAVCAILVSNGIQIGLTYLLMNGTHDVRIGTHAWRGLVFFSRKGPALPRAWNAGDVSTSPGLPE